MRVAVVTFVPNLNFQIEGADALPNAATPQIVFRLRVTNSEPSPIQSVALRVQAQIEPVRRRYTPKEQQQLRDLFGEPERWSTTLHSLLWANVNVTVPAFTGETVVDVPVPCTFDFNVAVTKYIYGLEDGDLPTSLLFNGTIFHAEGARLQIAQIPWDKEASYRLPVRVWKQMMDLYYPNTAWLTVRRDVFDRLHEFKSRNGFPTWDQALEQMLGLAEVKA
jgi:hypothetical protein